jgi:hypothetical protein
MAACEQRWKRFEIMSSSMGFFFGNYGTAPKRGNYWVNKKKTREEAEKRLDKFTEKDKDEHKRTIPKSSS